jgi:hypothetical protein
MVEFSQIVFDYLKTSVRTKRVASRYAKRKRHIMISAARIAKLASRKNVRAIAVENFLASLDGMTRPTEAWGNLAADARSYKWNSATVAAINAGILEHFSR